MKTSALYARVSSDRQAENETIHSQILALRERAAAEGHVVLPSEEYIDEGFSGSTLARPALERLRDRIAEGGVDIVYVLDPDRLARRYAYQVVLLEEFSAHGVTVKFLHAPTQNNPEDALVLQFQGIIAEYERAKILDRCRRGRLHKARQGLVSAMTGAGYGWVYVRKLPEVPAHYEVVPSEAEVVRGIFEAFVLEQHSMHRIAATLTAEHVPTRRGAPRWDRSTVRGLLLNPAYTGRAAFGKTEAKEKQPVVRLHRGQPTAPRTSHSSERGKPSSEWITIPVPRIVSDELFEAAQQQLERNRRLRPSGSGHHLLAGLVVCAHCRYAFYGCSGGRPPRRSVSYRCRGTDGKNFAGGRVCDNPPVCAAALDDYVWGSVREVLRDPERMLAEWSRRIKGGETTQAGFRRDESAKLVEHLERSHRRLLDAYEAGAISLDELQQRLDPLKRRLHGARDDLKAAEEKLAEAVNLQAAATRLDHFAKRVAHGLERLTWEQRQQVLRALVARVEIGKENVTVVFRLPPPSGRLETEGSLDQARPSQPSDRPTGSYHDRWRDFGGGTPASRRRTS